MANISDTHGYVEVYPTKKGDTQAVEWFVDTMNRYYSSDYGMSFYPPYEEETDGCYLLDFYGSGRWAFHCNLEDFNDWYIVPTGYNRNKWNNDGIRERIHSYAQMNLLKLAIKQATKRIKKIEFHYYDYEPGAGFLVYEDVTLYFKNGFVTKLEDTHSEDLECNAENVIEYGFDDEAYDCSVFTLRRLNLSDISDEDACVLHMIDDHQRQELADHMAAAKGGGIFNYFPEFWDEYIDSVHEWMEKKCIIQEDLGEVVSKINNTILLLSGKKQRYRKKKKYTAQCVRDFFTIAAEATEGEAKDDVLSFLSSITQKPLCVSMFLEEIFLESI